MPHHLCIIDVSDRAESDASLRAVRAMGRYPMHRRFDRGQLTAGAAGA